MLLRLENSISSSNDAERQFDFERDIGISTYSLSCYPSLGGRIKQGSTDFIVHEILPTGDAIYDGSELGEDLGGMYHHCVLWKRGIDTFTAIKQLSTILNIPESDIGYAGLKDAQAESFQRISIWNSNKKAISDINLSNLKLFSPVRQKFSVKIGELLGNRFEIVIRDIKENWSLEIWNRFTTELNANGLLNFYGMQRFGSKRPILHKFGKLILQEKYLEAIKLYLGYISKAENENITSLRNEIHSSFFLSPINIQFPPKYSIENQLINGLNQNFNAKRIIFSLPKMFLRFSISAYQSYIFNSILSKLSSIQYSKLNEIFVPLPGYRSEKLKSDDYLISEVKDLLAKDDLSFRDFKHSEKILKSKGNIRKAIVFPKKFKHMKGESPQSVQVCFDLPKGSYATILLREII